jgi:hypothetical protein
MKRIAMIKNGIVQNIALWDGVSPWSPEGFILVDVTNLDVGPGFTYSNGVFTPPELP